ncbi:Eco57I restriction-modification methylase domain-containing protein [Loktanella sp. DJP18]|uniref:Eco57I restriction-modification methylase domain-containing protein n=1 Tax=Loktanella sp. DJP18 TaxID=3409788 RepID=UPI003BB5A594
MGIEDREMLGHALRTDRKASGATYTPIRLANAVAQTLHANRGTKEAPAKIIRILDPGCGDGSLSIALLATMSQRDRSRCSVTCVDIDDVAVNLTRDRLTAAYPDIACVFHQEDFIEFALNAEISGLRFDFIIANPPYVRIQSLPPEVRTRIKTSFDLSGRTDLAFPFILSIMRLLDEGGHAAVITSNRILSTAAGRQVREALLAMTRVTAVWDLGDTRLFDAAVLPAVLFFERPTTVDECGAAGAAFTAIYEISAAPAGAAVVDTHDLCCDLKQDQVKRTDNGRLFEQRYGNLDTSGTWRLASSLTIDWLSQVANHTWKNFEDVCKVSVGIKTTADKVFINTDWPAPRPELLRPLVTHHIASRYRPSMAPTHAVLYPHEVKDGRKAAVDLSHYPNSSAHLEHHRLQLEGRSYVIDAGRAWFEIWVPHCSADWDAPKIVFRDISERPTFWLETSGSVINGDCYWIKLDDNTDPDLIWLMLAVGNSALIETFYDFTFNERLYAGRRRFMTRHVRKFPIPDPTSAPAQRASSAARQLALDDMDHDQRCVLEREVDRAVAEAFGFFQK